MSKKIISALNKQIKVLTKAVDTTDAQSAKTREAIEALVEQVNLISILQDR